MSKGDKRRPGSNYGENYEKVFGRDATECPMCGEIELRPTGEGTWVECNACGHEEQ